MGTDLSTINGTKSGSDQENNWAKTILATEQEILRVKARLAGLRSALRVFKDRRAKGDRFPGKRKASKSRLLGQPKDL